MKAKKNKILIAICFLLIVMNLVPLIQAQTYYQSYFWVTEINQKLSIMRPAGDLDSDYVQLSEIVVGGYGNVTLLDGFSGEILSNYSISSPFSYTALAVGNLDDDASNEIVAGSINGYHLIVLDYNSTIGNFSKLWEKNYNVSQIQVSDLTGNLSNEVIIGDMLGNITVFNKDGVLLWTRNLTESIENFQCLDFSQDNKIDRILVLTNTFVTLFNTSGDLEWQAEVTSKPLNGLVGDIQGNTDLELIIKGQNITYCFDQVGVSIWNSTFYCSESPGIVLYNSSESQKYEILISGINGSYFLNGTDGSLIRSYLTNSSITSLAIGKIFGEPYSFLVMGDRSRNITIWPMDPVDGQIFLFINITLTGPVIDITLVDMNADSIPDIVAASSNGTVYVVGVPWLIDFNLVLVGVGIGCAVIAISIFIVIKMKPPETQSKKEMYQIK